MLWAPGTAQQRDGGEERLARPLLSSPICDWIQLKPLLVKELL